MREAHLAMTARKDHKAVLDDAVQRSVEASIAIGTGSGPERPFMWQIRIRDPIDPRAVFEEVSRQIADFPEGSEPYVGHGMDGPASSLEHVEDGAWGYDLYSCRLAVP